MFDNQEIERFIGRSFGGYRVTRFIASGRTGVVFAGVQEGSPENVVAIKLLDPELTDETFNERFEQEALGVTGLSHPNIVRVLDVGSDGTLHFIITELIEGQSLRERISVAHSLGSSLPAETITSIAQQIGGALFFAHRSGYVHGDIKPENILITHDGWVHVSDFGLVRAIGEHRITSGGVPAGTPEYLSPEQARGEHSITPLADLYSLAIVTYEMTVGRVPFQARSIAALIRMQEHAAPPPPSSLLPGFPPRLESVLMRALEKDPASRFESVDAFLGSLLAAMVPATRTMVLEAEETAFPTDQPPAEVAPASPEAPAPEPEHSTPMSQYAPANTDRAASPSPFAAARSRRVVLAGGALAIVIAALFIFSPVGFLSAGPSGHPVKTIATPTGSASPSPSEPAASPPPAPSPTPPPVQAAPPPPPPAASSAPVVAAPPPPPPPPPPPSAKPVEHAAVPVSAGSAQPAEPPPPPPPSPPSSPTARVTHTPHPTPPPPPSSPPRWEPPPPPPPREMARHFMRDFFSDHPPEDWPGAGPDQGPPPRERSERDFVRDFFNEP